MGSILFGWHPSSQGGTPAPSDACHPRAMTFVTRLQSGAGAQGVIEIEEPQDVA
jgi:hypothetical protein